MTSAAVILDPDDARSRWQDLESSSTYVTPFSDPDFVESLSALYGWTCRSIFVPGAGAWVVQRRSGPFREWVLPPFAPYSAVSFDSTASLICLMEAMSEMVPGILISLSPDCPIPESLPRGWERHEKSTYVLNPKNGRTLWSRTPKRTFRKQEENYCFVEGDAAAESTIRYAAEAFSRHGRNMSLSDEALLSFCRQLGEKGVARPVGVQNRKNGKVEAGLVILTMNETAYSWIAGSTRGPAMTVLFGFVTDHLASEGFQRFDLVGANVASIAEFKRQFGGELVGYPHFVYGPHPLLTASRKVLNLLR